MIETKYLDMARDFVSKDGLSIEEYTAKVREAAEHFRSLYEAPAEPEGVRLVSDPKTAIKEATITCCVCGKTCRAITAKHLAKHGLTPKEYKTLCGYKNDTSLTCKFLSRSRRKRMQDLKLWELHKKADDTAMETEE